MSSRQTNNAIALFAVVLLLGFVVSCVVSMATKGVAETCSTWVVLPLLGLLVVVGK